MFKIITTILNLIVLLFILWVVMIEQDAPDLSDPTFLLFLAMCLAPIFNLIYIYTHKDKDNNNWLSLYLERKALEERKKIEDIQKH